jgi:hypothetical protein
VYTGVGFQCGLNPQVRKGIKNDANFKNICLVFGTAESDEKILTYRTIHSFSEILSSMTMGCSRP